MLWTIPATTRYHLTIMDIAIIAHKQLSRIGEIYFTDDEGKRRLDARQHTDFDVEDDTILFRILKIVKKARSKLGGNAFPKK